MNDEIAIRRARNDDIDNVAELATRSFVDAFGDQNDPADLDAYLKTTLSLASFEKQFADDRSIFLAATASDSDSLAGYAKLRLSNKHASVSGEKPIEIERIYSDSAMIGRGVGAALMRSCLAEAAKLERDVIWLGVWEQNEHAIRFYKRWEFEVTGSQEFMLGSDLQNDLVMARKP